MAQPLRPGPPVSVHRPVPCPPTLPRARLRICASDSPQSRIAATLCRRRSTLRLIVSGAWNRTCACTNQARTMCSVSQRERARLLASKSSAAAPCLHLHACTPATPTLPCASGQGAPRRQQAVQAACIAAALLCEWLDGRTNERTTPPTDSFASPDKWQRPAAAAHPS